MPLAPDPKLAPISLAPAPASLTEPDAMTADVPLDGARPAPVAALLPLLDLRLGFRNQLIYEDSYDLFSENDALPVFQLTTGVSFHDLAGGGAIAGVASVEVGGSSASLRGLPTELDVVRLGLGPELRLPVAERLQLSGRLSPQAVLVSTQLNQSQLGGMRYGDEQWTFGVDASVGAALRIAQLTPAGLDRALGLFLRVEAGYAWSPALDLELAASNGPVRSAPLPLDELALHGLSFGAALGIGY